MLSLIHIQNMAVIEQCEVKFSKGFNVLTGETGAGKSIIIDSIGALLGQRVTRDLVRYDSKKAIVLGIFEDISQSVIEILTEYGIDISDNSLHVQREISADGKSVCRINYKPVTLSILKEIAPYLVNIHGQHDGQKLMSEQYHINFLDSFGDNHIILAEYRKRYNEYYQTKKKLTELMKNNDEIDSKIEYLEYFIKEMELANISLNEEEELLAKRHIFENYEKTEKALSGACHNLNGEAEFSAYDLISKASAFLSGVEDLSSDFKKMYEKCEDIKYQLEELSSSINSYITDIDFKKDDIDYIEDRLDLIYSIKRKHQNSLEQAFLAYEEAVKEIDVLKNIDKSKAILEEEYKLKRANLIEAGKKLSHKRNEDAKKLEKLISFELSSLDMSSTEFSVSVTNTGKLSSTGIDNVVFLIATNKGDTLKPLSKIASGGELSRIMLAIKNILASSEEVSTLIFDEVDTGVSGRAALKIANKLYDVSRKKQVLCVTHLASIAAMADSHYLIDKSHTDTKTFTAIVEMNIDERKNEIARIVGGEVSDISTKNAAELIKNANLYKKQEK